MYDIPSSPVNLAIIKFPFFHLQKLEDIANNGATRTIRISEFGKFS